MNTPITQRASPYAQLATVNHLLVPFRCERALDANVFYRSKSCSQSDAELISDHSYISSDSAHDATETLWAERYGGTGIYSNGGAGRSGYNGTFSIKGIGRTPLASNATDKSHSDGFLALSDAISEMFWTELLWDVLPVGVVQARAIIKLKGDRALLLREPCVRVGHFERAVYFKPDCQAHQHRLEDVQRTRSCCKAIETFLPLPLQGDTKIPKLEGGLMELARRYAHQLAYSRSIFISYTLSSSNLTIDGKWVDAIAISLHPNSSKYSREFRAGWNRSWTEELTFSHIVQNLVFYLSKYSESASFGLSSLYRSVMESFKAEYRIRLAEYLLCLCGVPSSLAKLMSKRADCVQWALSFNDFLIDYPSKLASRLSHPRNRHLLFHASFAPFGQSNFANTGFCELMSSEVQSLHKNIAASLSACGQKLGLTPIACHRAVAINARKFTEPRPELDFLHLKEKFNRAATSCAASTSSWIDELKAKLRPQLCYDQETLILLWNSPESRLQYDLRSDIFIFRTGVEDKIPSERIFDAFASGRLVGAPTHFDEHFWAAFKNISVPNL